MKLAITLSDLANGVSNSLSYQFMVEEIQDQVKCVQMHFRSYID